MRTGGQILVDQLRIHGVDTVFCVPGESYLAALDAFHDVRDEIRVISCRHESGAAFMAEAYGKLTGKPGIVFVTRAPGACNASIGIHTGFQDSTPMVLFIGQVARGQAEREAFQEVDFRRMYGEFAKWVAQIEDPARLPELVSQAFHRASAGRPGPTVLALPEDMLTERVGVADAGPYRVVQASPSAEQIAALRAILGAAERPIVLLGGGGWSASAQADITAFAERNGLPVACAFRNQDRFDNFHDHYIGDAGIGANPALSQRIKDADVVLAIGPRLGEMTSQNYSLFTVPVPKQRLIHVHAGAEELGRVYQAELMINAGMAEAGRALEAMAPLDGTRWSAWREGARADYLAWLAPSPHPGEVDMNGVMRALAEALPEDAIVTNDAGNFSGWAHRYHRFRRWPSQLGPTNGAMGYGVPAAIGAKAACPDREVVCFVGDGGFLMTGNEIATALLEGLAPLILVIDNGMYGTIRMHQERDYPGRTIATTLASPDFAALARAFGAHGESVRKTEEFAPALARARAAGTVAVIDIKLDPDAITTRTTLRAIRAAAEARLAAGG